MRVSAAIRSPFQTEVNEYMQREGFMLLDPADSFKLDGELHTRRRKLVAHAFTGPAVAAMEARVAAICHDKAATFSGERKPIWSGNTPLPIPILVICDALGLPMDRVDEISRGADSMVAQVGAVRLGRKPYQHARNVMQLHRFVREAIEERRLNPGTDLISLLIHARADDPSTPPLTGQRVDVNCNSCHCRRGGSTRNGIAFALHALATPARSVGALALVQGAGQGQSDAFMRKCCGFIRRCRQLPRIARKETVLGGKTIPQGAFAFPLLGVGQSRSATLPRNRTNSTWIEPTRAAF